MLDLRIPRREDAVVERIVQSIAWDAASYPPSRISIGIGEFSSLLDDARGHVEDHRRAIVPKKQKLMLCRRHSPRLRFHVVGTTKGAVFAPMVSETASYPPSRIPIAYTPTATTNAMQRWKTIDSQVSIRPAPFIELRRFLLDRRWGRHR